MAGAKDVSIAELRLNTEDPKRKLAELNELFNSLKKRKHEALLAGDGKLFKSLNNDMKMVAGQMKEYKKEVYDVEYVLKNLNKVSLNQLYDSKRKLSRSLNTLSRDSDKYIQKQYQLKKVEEEIARAQDKRSNSPWAKGLMFAGGAAALKLLERYGGRAVEMYSRLDDKMADVIKTTGLTKDEVIALDEALMKLDIRSSREELLDLARIGGKLGLTDPAEVEAFVRAADKIKVALAEDLGGNVEEAVRKIGKLTDIFHLQEELGLEKAILSVGSAINALGADSTAGEEYLVEFTNRTAGVAPAAKISIANVMGLGAAMDNLGQSAQVGGTTYSQVVTGMFGKTEKYAKIAGMELKEFKDLLETDANEAFLRFLDGLNGSDGLEGTIKRLGELKLSGSRSTQVLGALAGNVDLIRERQRVANEEFEKGTSVIDEYNTKNESAQGLMEKRRKAIDQQIATLGERLFPLWSEALGFQGNMLKVLNETIKLFFRYKDSVVIVVGGLTAYIAVKKLQVFWSKANRAAMLREMIALKQMSVATGAVTRSTVLMASAKNLLAGNLRAAATGFKLFFSSIGPFGWIVAGITLVTAAVAALNTKFVSQKKLAKDLTSINTKAAESYAGEKTRLEELLRIATEKETSDKNRLIAIKALQEVIPDGIDLINEETIATGEAKKAVDKYCESLLLQAKIQAAREKLVELNREKMDAQETGSAGALNWLEKWYVANLKAQGRHKKAEREMTRISAENLEAWEEQYQTRTGNVMDLIKQWQKEVGGVVFGNLIDDDPEDKDPKPGNSSSKDKWSLEKDKAFLGQKLELRQRFMDKEIQTEEEFNRLVLQAEIEAYERRLATGAESGEDRLKLENDLAEKRYQLQKREQDRLDKLLAASLEGGDGTSTKVLYDQEKLSYEKRLKELGLFNRDRETMTRQELAALENLEKNHTLKLQKIYIDHIVKESSRKQAEAKRDVNSLKIRNNQELAEADSLEKKKKILKEKFNHEGLANIKSNAQAEKLLKKYYQQGEQRELEKHLTDILGNYTAFLTELKNSVSDNGVDLGILNDEEVARVEAIIDSLNEQLAALRNGSVDGKEKGTGANVDVLGFSQSDWEKFFENLAEGENGLFNWQMALEAVMNSLNSVNSLIVACEKRELKNYEKVQDKKKQALEQHLERGVISQEEYNDRIQEIDEETAAKKEELERKQAIREKALAVMQAGINTALGITAALAKPGGPAGIALAALVGAMGAVQIATILATPIGYEEGGIIDVERQQDGRRFRAHNSPGRRGRIDSPTVLVAENGPEYVVPNEGYRNPTIRPVLDVIESARQAGNLRDIDLNRAMGLPVYGRVDGGFTTNPSAGQSHTTIVNGTSDEIISRLAAVLEQNTKALDRLNGEIDKGIGVKLGGRVGLISKVRDLIKQINNSRV